MLIPVSQFDYSFFLICVSIFRGKNTSHASVDARSYLSKEAPESGGGEIP
jgi:hypothetical protein